MPPGGRSRCTFALPEYAGALVNLLLDCYLGVPVGAREMD